MLWAAYQTYLNDDDLADFYETLLLTAQHILKVKQDITTTTIPEGCEDEDGDHEAEAFDESMIGKWMAAWWHEQIMPAEQRKLESVFREPESFPWASEQLKRLYHVVNDSIEAFDDDNDAEQELKRDQLWPAAQRILRMIPTISEEGGEYLKDDGWWHRLSNVIQTTYKDHLSNDTNDESDADDEAMSNISVLLQLVANRDDALAAAFAVFLETQDLPDLYETLDKLATDTEVVDDDVIEDEWKQELLLCCAEYKRTTSETQEDNSDGIPLDEVALASLLYSKDPQFEDLQDCAVAAWELYSEMNDSDDLVDTLNRTLLLYVQAQDVDNSVSTNSDREEEEEVKSSPTWNWLEENLSESDLSVVEKQTLRNLLFVRESQQTTQHAHLISLIDSAIEVFSLENDQEELEDTLSRIARHAQAL